MLRQRLVALPIKAVEMMEDGAVRVDTADDGVSVMHTVIRGQDGRPSIGDYVLMGDGQPPRWQAKADYEAWIAKAEADGQAEADRIEALTPEQRTAEILALYR